MALATKALADEPECAQGHQFTFSGVKYRATSVKFSQSAAEQDVTDLSTPSGSYRKYAAPCILDGAEVSIEFWGKSAPPVLTKADIVFDGIDGVEGKAICTSIELDASVGQRVKGTAKFRLSSDDDAKDAVGTPDAGND